MSSDARMTENHQLLLIDGSYWFYRAFHALPPLTTTSGEPTGALFGMLNMLHTVLADHPSTFVAVVFDTGKSFREALFPEYKAHRPAPDPHFVAQMAPLEACITALGLPIVRVAGVEADDVIATLTQQATARGYSVLIASSDKDLMPLVGDRVHMLDSMKGTLIDTAAVIAKFGVPPAQMADYLSLMGDTADNIPGVPGIGAVSAKKLLQQFDNIDHLLAAIDQVPGKLGRVVRAGVDALQLSRQLVRLECAVPLPVMLEDLRPRAPDRETLRTLYQRYELLSLLRALPPSGAGVPPVQYAVVVDAETLSTWVRRCEEAYFCAIHVETTGTPLWGACCHAVAIAASTGQAAYIPINSIAYDHFSAPACLSWAQVLAGLRPLLEAEAVTKVVHDLKPFLHWAAQHSIRLQGPCHDTALMSYVLDATARHEQTALAERYLHHIPIRRADADIASKASKTVRQAAQQCLWEATPVAHAAPSVQAATDGAQQADITGQLFGQLWPKTQALSTAHTVYAALEIPLVPVLARMERRGIRVDTVALRQQGQELATRLWALEQRAFALAGGKFNLGSPKQLQAVLFDRLGLPVGKKTAKGQVSTNEEVLQGLAQDYELPRIILEHRMLGKLKSTYTDKLPELVHAHTGRIHSTFHQTVTSTGRLSSTDPNVQNIPVRTPEGRKIRQAFVPEDGYLLLSADYSQIELRIMAHLSGDSGLQAAFAMGEDVHRATAAEVLGIPVAEVTTDQRRSAKAINFGLIYGMSAFGLAKQLGVDRDTAQAQMGRYFARYPHVQAFMEQTRQEAIAQGFVQTVFGRRLYLPELHAGKAPLRQAAERAAINAPLQGTAADIIKQAMITIDAGLEAHVVPARLLLQVHDELVFEVLASAVEEARAWIRAQMMGAADLAVPLIVDVGVGHHWDEAH